MWLLDGFRVSVGDRTVEEGAWRLKKAASLVKLLVLARGHHLHRERVLDLLWPTLGSKAASNNLRGLLHVARKALTPDCYRRTISGNTILYGDRVSYFGRTVSRALLSCLL